MHPEHSKGLQDARAKALTEAHAHDNGALYVVVAKYKDKEDTYVAVAIRTTTGEINSACTNRAKQAHQAEGAANALALPKNKCTTILSDSRTAVRNYGRNEKKWRLLEVRFVSALPIWCREVLAIARGKGSNLHSEHETCTVREGLFYAAATGGSSSTGKQPPLSLPTLPGLCTSDKNFIISILVAVLKSAVDFLPTGSPVHPLSAAAMATHVAIASEDE
ncbi:hypothetical protein MRX96_041230 [Rhipicephalus microplus]